MTACDHSAPIVIIIGAGILSLTFVQLLTGKSMNRGGPVFTRKKDPFGFWLNVTMTSLLGPLGIFVGLYRACW